MSGDGTRVRLGSWPTPLEAAPRLAVAIGLAAEDLWLKRDDLTGLGAGGNKVRKLEHLCGEALSVGATTLVTSGAAQSNHARLTAAAGARLGLRVVLVLQGSAPPEPLGNLLLDALLDAELVWAGPVALVDLQQRVETEVARRRSGGEVAVAIPYGGSSLVGARGYVDCATELLRQVPDLDHVVSAVGSGATLAGLVAGLGTTRALGVDTGAVPDPAHRVEALLAEMDVDASGLRLRPDQVGAGYATLTPAVRDALRLAARTEGVVLDPVYTGRALAGLVAEVADGSIRPGERTVLLHSGGLPGLFGHAGSGDLL